jgi:signal transduction histidine kinase
MQQFVGTSLKMRLYALVLAAFLPIAFLIVYIAEEQKAMEQESILRTITAAARAAANEENQQLESIHDLLTVITDSFLIAEGRPEKFSDLLTNLLRQSKGYERFGIIDRGGQVVAGSDPSMIGQDYSGKVWFSTILRSKEKATGLYPGEPINGEPSFYAACPALNSRGDVVAVAFAALTLNGMNRAIIKQLTELPEGSRLTLLDETQGMLRYTIDTRQWSVPQTFNPTLRREIIDRQSGTLSATDENNNARVYAFAPLQSPLRNRPVYIVLEVYQSSIIAASRQIFLRNMALLVLSVLIALLFIWWAGNTFILRRVSAMVGASRKLASGDLSARIGKIGPQDELNHLAGVFDEMAASLQKRIEKETQVTASLKRSREQLRSLAAYQNEVREQERIRIAREIHDQLGQSLTLLRMDLSWLKKQLEDKNPTVDEKMDAMFQVLADALENLHTVTTELRPIILDDFGLAAAIEWQVEEFRNRVGIECRMASTGFEPVLPKDQATALFRIFQETLTNIIRHARASEVEVRLETRQGDLILQIQDNGRGITAAEIDDPKSFGLLGIRERLYPWNGRVSFEGRPGQGTRVTVRLPMPPKGALS